MFISFTCAVFFRKVGRDMHRNKRYLFYRYHLVITKSNADGDINMKRLGQKSIGGIWAISLLLSGSHIISMILIPSYLKILSKWIASSLAMVPVLISASIYFKMRKDLEQNQVRPIANNDPVFKRIEILQSGYQPYMRREAEAIFAGKKQVSLVNIVASR